MISIIDIFFVETPARKSPLTKRNVLYIIIFCAHDQILKMKNNHKVASKYPKVVEGSQWFFVTDVLDNEESSAYGVVDDDGDALEE